MSLMEDIRYRFPNLKLLKYIWYKERVEKLLECSQNWSIDGFLFRTWNLKKNVVWLRNHIYLLQLWTFASFDFMLVWRLTNWVIHSSPGHLLQLICWKDIQHASQEVYVALYHIRNNPGHRWSFYRNQFDLNTSTDSQIKCYLTQLSTLTALLPNRTCDPTSLIMASKTQYFSDLWLDVWLPKWSERKKYIWTRVCWPSSCIQKSKFTEFGTIFL